MAVTTTAAYVLSKKDLPGQRVIMFLIVFTMMFSGGLIPTFLIVRSLGIMNTQWALIWPVTVITFNLIILRNFFSSLPKELEESAMIDGCTEVGILAKIVLPVSKPAIVTITLFYAVFHWNDFFQAVLYITSRDQWPLQLFLRSLLFEDEAVLLGGGEALFLLGQPMQMATVMVAILPIMCIFPFFSKYFAQGVMVGAVKG
jgi:putative aldouronate transport system permease protein